MRNGTVRYGTRVEVWREQGLFASVRLDLLGGRIGLGGRTSEQNAGKSRSQHKADRTYSTVLGESEHVMNVTGNHPFLMRAILDHGFYSVQAR